MDKRKYDRPLLETVPVDPADVISTSFSEPSMDDEPGYGPLIPVNNG
jgi:hypothetical protein